MVDLSKSYIRTNINSLGDTLGDKYSPGQIVSLIEFTGKNKFDCTSYQECLSDKWKVVNWVCQGVSHVVYIFNFLLNEVLIDIGPETSLEFVINGYVM